MRDLLSGPLTGSHSEPHAGRVDSTYPSVAVLAADIGLSERSTRNALRRGEIPHIRVGRRFILPKAAIAEWLRTAGGRFSVEPTAEHPDHGELPGPAIERYLS